MKVLTLGCSDGLDATAWHTIVTNPRYHGLSGNPEYEAIECQIAPKQGRAGGGLFTTDGYLAGVCNFSEPKGDHGLYASPDSIYRFLDRNHLTFLYDAPMVAEKEIDELLGTAEGHIKKDEWEEADRTMQYLDALIEERRKGLHEAIRSLDANYSRRRDELFHRASKRRPVSHSNAIPKENVPDPGLEFIPDAPTHPGIDTRLGGILDEWQRQSAARTSLDVRFTGRERTPAWGEDEPLAGRIVLSSGGRAFVEVIRGVGKVSNTDRIIWTDDAVHQFRSDVKQHFVWPVAAKDRRRLPAFLALPFFWNLRAEDLKSRYELELLKEDIEVWFLRVTPLSRVGRESFSKAIIELDRTTYLPRRYLLINPDGKSTKEFRVAEARCNQPISEDVWRIPDVPGWKIMRPGEATGRFLRLFTPDLLP